MNPLKVMVVDDTIVYRKIVTDILSELSDVEVVGTASNGKLALHKIPMLKPDLITLDIEMPEMNGLDFLTHVQEEWPEIGVVMLSTSTQEGGEMTIRALELGAFDFIPKPLSGTMADNKEEIKKILTPMLKAFKRRREIQNILSGKHAPSVSKTKSTPPPQKKIVSEDTIAQRMKKVTRQISAKSEIVAIGISTGGPNALAKMMPMIPPDIGVPILIVQHMPPIFTESLAKSLDAKSALPVREARDGQILTKNTALIAPGGKHMKIVASADGMNRIIRITDDPPENSCRPSVDYLFRSIAEHYVGRATGVIMTGMGADGCKGAKLLKKNGAFIIAQDEDSCTVFGMPKEIIEADLADAVVSLDIMAQEIVNSVAKKAR
ncbi:MAG: chemotaxis response regulator protein-glutamate methylesterase [Desulfobacterium sp.]|nr:chemotaxis response regulator protein-glutamate methylesterase [Desulfobacterium sp.]